MVCLARDLDSKPHSDAVATVEQVFDESASQYFAQNNATFGPGPTFGLPPLLLSQTVYKPSINGLQWCTLKGLTAEVGSRVRWHIGGQVWAQLLVRHTTMPEGILLLCPTLQQTTARMDGDRSMLGL